MAVDKKGKKAFLNSQDWPVTENQFKSLYNSVFLYYFRLINKLDIDNYYVGITETHFLNTLIQILHYNYVKNYSKKKKYKVNYTVLSEPFYNPNWNALATFYSRLSCPYNKLQRSFRRLIKLFYFNRHLSFYQFFMSLISKKINISLGSLDQLKKEYIYGSKLLYIHEDWIDLIDKEANKNIDKKILKNKVKCFRNKILIKFLSKVFNDKKNIAFTNGLSLSKILNVWEQRIYDIFSIQYSIKKFKKINEVLITENGNPFHKIIGASLKKKNAKIINFSHGNELLLIDKTWTNKFLFSISDNYIFESNGVKNFYNNIKNKCNHLHLKEDIRYKCLFSKTKNPLKKFSYSNHKPIKKIMIMGYPMNAIRYTNEAYLFFHYKLNLELHLISQLKATDFNVKYKAHPDRLLELGKIYEREECEIITDRFEKSWKQADALVFTYVSTTTFGFALSCPIPIVLIASDDVPWIKERKSILEERVSIIPLNNRYNLKQINAKKLKEGINDARRKVCYNTVKKIII